MTPLLSVVMPYYNNPQMVKRHFLNWGLLSNKSKANTEFVLVDDGSKEHPLRVYPIEGVDVSAYVIHDDILWNVGGAKNLGADRATGGYLLITDIDRLITDSFLDHCFGLVKEGKRNYYVFGQINSDGSKRRGYHQGTLLVKREWFWDVKGYDEDFSGSYGHEDGHLLKKLRTYGLKQQMIKQVRLVAFDKDPNWTDASTPEELYGDRRFNGKLSKRKGNEIPESSKVLRFDWSYCDHLLS